MSHIPSKKSITVAVKQVDTGNAERFAHERFNIPDADHCVNPNLLDFDQYHRQANHNSLTRTQGGSCSIMDPYHNVEQFMIRENNVDRPYIDHDIGGGQMYDTMGKGRQYQQSYSGGAENNQGGWKRINMPRESMYGNYSQAPQYYHTDSAKGNKNMASMEKSVYQG